MDNHSDDLIHLRILVLTLGESHHANWWSSQFLSPTGLSFLDRIYPRSKFAAAVRSATRGALTIHDEKIGRGEVFHLFRLPRHLELEFDEQLSQRSAEFESVFAPRLTQKEDLLQSLLALSGSASDRNALGPVEIDAPADQIVGEISAYYYNSFRIGGQVFPYFIPS